ncbi:hypothetical protein JD844_022698 [Phrynosoma platyrhinos]|uniref:C-type lectin domain-containing protein n=1 Tax=Phrynosoma platyrhinos TaxID=52577 RepID=A0ABQ7SVP9_PHRPL|nr:hypothetical protein JD844_022698 [Phrynosoma platyrhinos]
MIIILFFVQRAHLLLGFRLERAAMLYFRDRWRLTVLMMPGSTAKAMVIQLISLPPQATPFQFTNEITWAMSICEEKLDYYDAFKWYDKSKVNFTNWMEEESNEELLNTCATMHTTSGGWEKTTCEHLPLTQILCETAKCFKKTLIYFLKFSFACILVVLYEKEYLLGEKAWTTTLVITSTIVVAVSAAFLWFLYQRRVSSGTRCIVHNPAIQVSSNSDEDVLIEEENEYTV